MLGGAPTKDAAQSFARICPERARPYLLTAAILASALGFIDGSAVALALPAIRESLGADLAAAQWIANAYMLSLGALTLVGGALGDKFGRVRVFAGGIALFIVTSLFCAVAPTPGALIAARAAQGVGAALMVPGALALIATTYPLETRGAAIGTWAAASAVTTALGPVLAGGLITLMGPEAWRAIFAVNLPLGAVALWLLWRYAEAEAPRRDVALDLPGAAAATLGLGLVAWALTGSEHGSNAPANALLFGAAGAAVLGLFLAIEARSPRPMMPLRLFGQPVFATANLLTFTLYFALSGVLFLLPMAAVGGWGVSTAAVSVGFLPLTICVSVMSRPVGRWADRVGPRVPLSAGCALVAVGYGAMAATAPAQAFWALTLPALTVAAVGMGLVVAPLSTAVMGAVADDETGIASGINNAVARLAGLIAVAALGTLAAVAYAEAGGTLDFGATGRGPAHADASAQAFALTAWVTAGLAAVSGALALLGLGGAPVRSEP